ncbi:MAG: hypothetical protein IJ455_07480, partial [Agathobacter sp.]|nr:hypothetical protein [Agathobacter sp.]
RYAPLAKMQAKAMLEVSPELELFSSGPYPNQEWADKSAKVLASEVQYASLHYYSKTSQNYSTLKDVEETCKEIFSAPETNLEVIKQMRECLGNGIHISFDEWNCWYAWYRPSSAAEGIYAAKMLHMLMHESERLDVPVCCYFQPVGEGAIEIGPNESLLTGIGQSFSFLKSHRGGLLCRIDSMNEFEAAATVKEGILTVTLINTDLNNSKVFMLNKCGQIMSAEVLSSEGLLPHSRFEKMDLTVTSEKGMFKAELPAHSIAKITMKI